MAGGTPSDFVSGHATDYDGDGCEDASEQDLDRDNDGVTDAEDGCAYSVAFDSNANTDFDRDGCLDGVEDEDDDGDSIANVDDDCDRTEVGAAVDAKGCSLSQTRRRRSAKREEHASRASLAVFEALAGVLLGAALPRIYAAARHRLAR